MTTLAINGCAAEATVQRLAKAALLKPLTFDTLHLLRTAQHSPIGRKRLKSAMPYLRSEYGRRAPNGNYAVDWESVPPTVVLDYIYGINAAFLFRGWHIALDVTANRTALADKQAKLEWLKPLWKAIGIDFSAVAKVSTHATPQTFVQSLRRIIQGDTAISL